LNYKVTTETHPCIATSRDLQIGEGAIIIAVGIYDGHFAVKIKGGLFVDVNDPRIAWTDEDQIPVRRLYPGEKVIITGSNKESSENT
jgi:hypothetical protein